MHNNRNNRETVIIPQTIIVPTKFIIVASLFYIEPTSYQVNALSEINKTVGQADRQA